MIANSPIARVPSSGGPTKNVALDELETTPQSAERRAASARSRTMPWMGLTALLVISGLVGLSLWSRVEFGSIESAIGRLRGERLIPDAYSKSIGSVEQGSTPVVAFTLRNFTRRPITIVGGSSTCTCVLIENNFPLTIPASKNAVLKVVLRTNKRRGGLAESVRLYSDIPDAPMVVLRISGRVVDVAKAAGASKARKQGS